MRCILSVVKHSIFLWEEIVICVGSLQDLYIRIIAPFLWSYFYGKHAWRYTGNAKHECQLSLTFEMSTFNPRALEYDIFRGNMSVTKSNHSLAPGFLAQVCVVSLVHSSMPDALTDSKACLSSSIPTLNTRMTQHLTDRSCRFLKSASEVPRLYRRTNKVGEAAKMHISSRKPVVWFTQNLED